MFGLTGPKSETIAIALRYGHLPSDQATFSFGVDKLTNTAKATDSKANDRALVRSRSDNSGGLFRPYADEGEDSPKNPFGRFHYLQAERHGPRKFLPMANERAAGVTLGTRGEFVLHFLHLYQDSILLAEFRILENGRGHQSDYATNSKFGSARSVPVSTWP